MAAPARRRERVMAGNMIVRNQALAGWVRVAGSALLLLALPLLAWQATADNHVAIDAACTPAGQVIPADAQHLSLPQGVTEDARFGLPLGQHRLCLQAANPENIALAGPGMTRVIDVTIQSVEEPGSS